NRPGSAGRGGDRRERLHVQLHQRADELARLAVSQLPALGLERRLSLFFGPVPDHQLRRDPDPLRGGLPVTPPLAALAGLQSPGLTGTAAPQGASKLARPPALAR